MGDDGKEIDRVGPGEGRREGKVAIEDEPFSAQGGDVVYTTVRSAHDVLEAYEPMAGFHPEEAVPRETGSVTSTAATRMLQAIGLRSSPTRMASRRRSNRLHGRAR